MCVLFYLQLLSERFPIQRRNIIISLHGSSCTRYSCKILIKLEFSKQIFEKPQISNFTKIRPMEVELFHATDERTNGPTDRQTDMTKLTVAFRNLSNTPKKK